MQTYRSFLNHQYFYINREYLLDLTCSNFPNCALISLKYLGSFFVGKSDIFCSPKECQRQK